MEGTNTEFNQFIKDYAESRNLQNVLKAQIFMSEIMDKPETTGFAFKKPSQQFKAYYRHAMSVAKMLIDLHLALPVREKDIAISAALCHVLPELFAINDWGKQIMMEAGLDEEVWHIVSLITREESLTMEQNRLFYQKIKENKLALLVRLADRSNLVEQLYSLSTWEARDYVRETRNYFLPLCIYAKEKYPQYAQEISILMEKMRSLIDVADILSTRYLEEEMTLTNEILELQEENARIRHTIRTLERED